MLQERIEKMEKELAELKVLAKKEEFKHGDWLYFTGKGDGVVTTTWHVGRVSKFNKVENDGLLMQDGTSNYINSFRKATPLEIESHLIKEAEKKGFVKGARVKRGNIDGIYFYPIMPKGKNSDCVRKFEKENGVNFLVLEIGCSTIPLEECDLPSSCPQITINGYKAEFKEWGLDFNNGCAKIDKQIFIDLKVLICNSIAGNGNKAITSANIGSGKFTNEQILLIAKHYENK